MKVGIFSVVDPDPRDPARNERRFAEAVRLAEAADAAGLSSVWVAEHHFGAAGLLPSPVVLLAAMGARTRRIRLGSLVTVLPFHEPVEVAEQFAVLDRLTDGRLNFGCGSGYLPDELDGFGVDAQTKRESFDRALDTILAAWSGAEVRVDRARATPVRLNVRPVQRPHPPVWIASQRREAIPFVARRGVSLALIPYATVGSLAELGEEIREFREAAPAGAQSEVAAAVHVYIGPNVAQARHALQEYLDGRLATMSTHYRRKVAADPRQARADAIEGSGVALVGDSPTVREGLRKLAAAGVDELLAMVDFGSIPTHEAERTIRSLGLLAADLSRQTPTVPAVESERPR